MISINWSRLSTFDYWLEGLQNNAGSYTTPTIPKESSFFWLFLNGYTTLICIGLVILFVKSLLHSKHPLQLKLPFIANNLIWMGITGISWFLCRQLEIWLLGSRIWILVNIIWIGVLLTLSIRYLSQFYPLELRYYRKNYKNEI